MTLLCLILIWAGPLQASSLRIKLRKESLGRIQIRVLRSSKFATQQARSKHRQNQLLFVEKSLNGGAFQSVASLLFQGRNLILVDFASSPGKYRYRLRYHASHVILPAKHKRVIEIAPADLGMSDPSLPDPATPIPITTPDPRSIPIDATLPAGLSECDPADVSRMLAALNQQRQLNGLTLLVDKALFRNAARQHAIKMASTQSFVHDGWFDELVAQGFSFGSAAQNIAKFISDPVDVVSALMTSPGHRANILNPVFQFAGVACVKDSSSIKWWVQDFGAGNY